MPPFKPSFAAYRHLELLNSLCTPKEIIRPLKILYYLKNSLTHCALRWIDRIPLLDSPTPIKII